MGAMFERDNINIDITSVTGRHYHSRELSVILKTYATWLDERNIKYSYVREPLWAATPTAINMRSEDALMFKLVFGL